MRSEISESLREKLKTLSSEDRARLADEVQEAVRDFFPDGQMRFPAQMLIVSGAKPSGAA
jgi:mRNA-degrading endonuclease RelE of RelBE toxin-antitoxin system